MANLKHSLRSYFKTPIFSLEKNYICFSENLYMKITIFSAGSAKCSKLFQNQEALTEHVSKCHDKSVKGDGSYCDTCGKFLPNVHRLKKHHDAHHRQIKCKVCGAYFPGTIK